ncbi:MAG: hypothetical protein CMI54_02255 [Parcubacteria group bacterium]|nr:hypothetical protein [Parcubacteria group bacterium]|tara:strand:+ start:2583 stop:2921 length:339 start_codon:yes stop_codon:yes gene_type:complete
MPKYQSFGEATKPPSFFPDDKRVELAELIDVPLVITDAVVVRNFETPLGKSDFALLRFSIEKSGEVATTLCGGVVVVNKVQKAIDGNLLPLTGTITRVPSGVAGHSPYYDIQ